MLERAFPWMIGNNNGRNWKRSGLAAPFFVQNFLIQLLNGQHGIAVGAVCIFCHQCNGCGCAVDTDDSSAGEGLFIGSGRDGNRGAGGGDGVPIQLQMQRDRKGGAGSGSHNGIIFDFIDAAFGKDKFRRAGCMGDCRACLCLIGGEGEGIACGGGGLCGGICGTAQIEGRGGAGCARSARSPGCAGCPCSAILPCATAKIMRISAGMLWQEGEYIYSIEFSVGIHKKRSVQFETGMGAKMFSNLCRLAMFLFGYKLWGRKS